MPEPDGGSSRAGTGGAAQRRVSVAVILLLLGAGVLTGAGWLWHRARPAPNVGVAQVNRLSDATAAPPAAGNADNQVPTQSAALPTAAPAIRPVRVRIDRLDVSATVIPVGVDTSGNVVVPSKVDTVGWYRYGPALGAAGSMVIAGHVDSAQQGDGAFARLRELNLGDHVDITGSDGRIEPFRVVGREEYPKATIRLDRYFATEGPPRLILITCGGRSTAAPATTATTSSSPLCRHTTETRAGAHPWHPGQTNP